MKLNQILKESSSPLKSELETLCDVIELLGNKLKDNYDRYKEEELSVTILKRDGQFVYRQNPFVQEYRATLRDYHQALSKLQDLIKDGNNNKADIHSLDEIRERFNINIKA